jgi:hypothetical protein
MLALTATAGCATMVHGRSQEVRVFSTPSGAALYVNGTPAGSTPTTIRIRRAATVDLRLEKTGHAAMTLRIPRSVSPLVTANGLVLNPYAAHGMHSMSQWATTALAWFAALVATDRLSGGMFVRPPFVEATLPPLDLPSGPTGAPSGCAIARAPAAGTPGTPAPSCR